MAKHTPGPWSTMRDWPLKIVPMEQRELADGMSIDEAYDRGRYAVVIATAESNDSSGFAHEISRDKAKANARLIAAAPDMVEALAEAERFMAYFSGETEMGFVGSGTPSICLSVIRAALKKARGE